MPFESIPYQFKQWGHQHPHAPAYAVKKDGQWITTTWKSYTAEVRDVALALMALGIIPGDRVAILGNNRPEWTLFDLGAMSAGGVPVGIYPTSSAKQIRYILDHAGVKVLLIEGETEWETLNAIWDTLPRLEHVVLMQGAPDVDAPLVMSWYQFLGMGSAASEADFQERLQSITPAQLGALVYTSGTTGPPKGVMLTHGNQATAALIAGEMIPPGLTRPITLSYLPLAHVAERGLSILGPAAYGYTVYYAESITQLPANLQEVRPHMFLGVPRVWEKFHAALSARMREAEGTRLKLLTWAMRIGRQVNTLRCQAKRPLPHLYLQYALANRLVYSKIKKALGLDRTRLFLSGAAPLDLDILVFFTSIDILIREAYGQSENCGPTTWNGYEGAKLGTVGRPYKGVELRLADDGEILVRGPNVFRGYYKDPKATDAILTDGWLSSGDVGTIDAEGFLTLTGRKKELIITAGGKNIAPRNLETALRTHDLVQDAVVIGDRRKYLVAVMTLNPETAAPFAAAHPNGTEPLAQHPKIQQTLLQHLNAVNADLAPVQRIKKFHLLSHPFSTETGELTPTLKLKRRVIEKRYAKEINQLYD